MMPDVLLERSGRDRRTDSRGGRRADDQPAPLHTLTTKQRTLLEFIRAYHETTGEPCPGSMLARRLSVHHSTIQEHLSALWRKGWLLTPNAPATPRQNG